MWGMHCFYVCLYKVCVKQNKTRAYFKNNYTTMSGLGDTSCPNPREASLKCGGVFSKYIDLLHRLLLKGVFQKPLARAVPNDLEKCANRLKESPGYHRETFGNIETKEECRDKTVFKAQM